MNENLRAENRMLKEQLELLVKDDERNQEVIIELKGRINKAIEYIKNNWYSKNTRNIDELHSLGDWRLDLLAILGDKE